MAIYDDDWVNKLPDNIWIKDIEMQKKAAEMDYMKKMMPPPSYGYDQIHINEILNKLINEDAITPLKKGTENHLGVIEDVKQPLILDPSLDF